MHLVIADTGPVNYLILIGHIDLLPCLFQRIVLPTAVQEELASTNAPPSVQQWIAYPPTWLEVVETQGIDPVAGLHRGESEAIALAASLHADMLLIDDRKAVKIARSKGFRVTGTLGLLEMAAYGSLINFVEAVRRLQKSTFRSPEALLSVMLEKHRTDSNT